MCNARRCRCRSGGSVLTPARRATKQPTAGKPPGDNLSREGKANPQYADRRRRIERVSRLLAKARRDKAKIDETGLIRQSELYPMCFHVGEIHPGGELRPGLTSRPDGSQALGKRELARKPTQPYLTCTYSYRRTRIALPGNWKAGLSSIERCGDRVSVVVVGVTIHQGARESRVQGEGTQVLFFKSGNGQR